MQGNSIINDMFSLSGRIGLGRFFALLAFDICMFFASIAAGGYLCQVHTSSASDLVLGWALMIGAVIAGPWALLSLGVRALRSIFHPPSNKSNETMFDAVRPDTASFKPLAEASGAHANDPNLRIIKAGRNLRWFALFLGIFVALKGRPDQLGPTDLPLAMWLGWILIVVFGILGFYDIFFGKREIRLYSWGFSISLLKGAEEYYWEQIVNPFVKHDGKSSYIEFFAQTRSNEGSAMIENPVLVKRRISNTYRLNLSDLTTLMNAYRDETLRRKAI